MSQKTQSINRSSIAKRVKQFVGMWQGSIYNLPDSLISPLYLQSLEFFNPKKKQKGIKERLKKSLYDLRPFLQGFSKISLQKHKPVQLIFYPATIAHVRQLLPITRLLKGASVSYVWIVTKKQLSDELNKASENFILVKGHYRISVSSWFSLRSYIRQLLKATDDHELRPAWEKVLKENSVRFLDTINLFEDVLTALRPSVLIVGNDLTFEGRIATRVFNRYNISTLCIQHGDVSGVLESEHIVRHFFVYGSVARSLLEKANPNTEFIISGCPFMDLLNTSRELHPEIARMLVVEKAYVLVAFSGAGNNTSFEHLILQIKSVKAFARKFPEVTVVIKLHPKDMLEHYLTEALQSMPNVRLVPFGSKGLPTSIFDWLSGSRFVITGASTTAIEAMSMQIPVLSLDYMDEYSDISFIKEGATILSRNEADFLSSAAELIIDTRAHSDVVQRGLNYSENYFHRSDQITASEVIVNRILSKL